MAENTARRQPEPPPDAGHIPMSEEMDSARWTLPPIVPVLAGIVLIAAIVGGVYWWGASKPVPTGRISNVAAVQQADGASVLAVVQFTLQNVQDRPLALRAIEAKLTSDQGSFTDEPASVVDIERLLAAYPDLRQYQTEPFKPNSRLAPGANQSGMIIVAFPVTKEQFDARKSLEVIFDPYDRSPFSARQ